MYVLSALNNCARAQAVNISESFKSLRICYIFHGYYEVRSDNVQRQFVYFIVAIIWNSFYRPLLFFLLTVNK